MSTLLCNFSVVKPNGNSSAYGFRLIAGLMLWVLSGICAADTLVQGQVLDINGTPLEQIQVTINRPAGKDGASSVTVFTDKDGRFSFLRPVKRSIRKVYPVSPMWTK